MSSPEGPDRPEGLEEALPERPARGLTAIFVPAVVGEHVGAFGGGVIWANSLAAGPLQGTAEGTLTGLLAGAAVGALAGAAAGALFWAFFPYKDAPTKPGGAERSESAPPQG
jgi:hypothetical protein